MSVNFGGWPSGIHSDFEQVKRIESGEKLKKKIVALDKEGQRIVIQGSAAEPYQATLQECTCADFAIRQAPCKHMYCLAMELGLLDGLPVYDKRSASYDPDSELKRYRSLYESGQISADAYVKVCSALAKLKK